MSIYLAAQSSLSYLERDDALRRPARVGSLEDSECSLRVLAERDDSLRALGCAALPVHLLVDRRERAVRTDWVECHIWDRKLPPNSFVQPVRGIFVSTPEFCFLQLASRTSRIELVRLGYELCSTYRLDPSSRRGFVERRILTTRERIAEYLDNAGDTARVRRARAALRWVVDGAASPRETTTSMIVSLPSGMGGRELGLPKLNWEVSLGEGGHRRRIDLCWPDRRFGLEYDSDLEHSSAGQMSRDSMREKEIELSGIRLCRVTNAEIRSEEGRDLLHKTLCRGLGKRYVEPSERTRFLRRRLAATLLSPHHSML